MFWPFGPSTPARFRARVACRFSIPSSNSVAASGACLASNRATSSRSAGGIARMRGVFAKLVEPKRQAKILGTAGEFRFNELAAKALNDFKIAIAELG